MQLVGELSKPGVRSDAELFSSADVSWELAYVSHLLELAAARNQAELRIQPEMLAFSLSGTSKLAPTTKVVGLTVKLEAIEKEHGISCRWESGMDPFESGLQALATHQLENIQLKVTALVQVRLTHLPSFVMDSLLLLPCFLHCLSSVWSVCAVDSQERILVQCKSDFKSKHRASASAPGSRARFPSKHCVPVKRVWCLLPKSTETYAAMQSIVGIFSVKCL
jgi:hypothetical protein